MAQSLKFGMIGRCFPPGDRALDAMRRAEAQGWDFMAFPDQLPSTHPDGMLPGSVAPPDDESLLVSAHSSQWFGSFELLTAASVLTERIGLQMAVVDPLRRSPAVFAQEAVTISHFSKGRAAWCIGSGEAKQFEPYGEVRSKPAARMLEAVRTMHALWDSGGETVSRDSEFWPLADATFTLPLYDGRKPSVLVVGGGPAMEQLAGELCDGWMTYLPGGVADEPEHLAAVISAIKKVAADSGRDPDALRFHAMCLTCLAETDDLAWRYARHPALAWASIWAAGVQSGQLWKQWGHEHPFGDAASWPKDMKVTGIPKEMLDQLTDFVPEEVTDRTLVWGSPDRVAARLTPFIDAGITELSFDNEIPWADRSYGTQWTPLISELITKLGGSPLDVGA
jgi:phthiodiolone/phenolphthiodiolone dimycocerosates ketoreductase